MRRKVAKENLIFMAGQALIFKTGAFCIIPAAIFAANYQYEEGFFKYGNNGGFSSRVQ